MIGRAVLKAHTLAHRVRRRLGPRAVVLMYHRIAEAIVDPFGLAVPPDIFDEQLRAIASVGTVMRLSDLAEAVAKRQVPHRAIAVTFDDGYADNFFTAMPSLERFGVPATVYMTGSEIGRQREFWWDELTLLLLEPGDLPERLSVMIDGQTHIWTLGGAPAGDFHWRWDSSAAAGPRQQAYKDLHRLLQPLAHVLRETLLNDLWQQAKRARPPVRPEYRALEPWEVATFGANGVIDVGVHTVTHPLLTAQPASVQQMEISENKADLEGLLGRNIDSMSYPYTQYSDQTIQIVKELGFTSACAGEGRPVLVGDDPFRLPRIDMLPWRGDAFAKKLEDWFKR